MIDPIPVLCPENIWTKVATGVKGGKISISDSRPGYVYTYIKTGEAAPIDESTSLPLPLRGAEVNNDISIDVYVMAKGSNGFIGYRPSVNDCLNNDSGGLTMDELTSQIEQSFKVIRVRCRLWFMLSIIEFIIIAAMIGT